MLPINKICDSPLLNDLYGNEYSSHHKFWHVLRVFTSQFITFTKWCHRSRFKWRTHYLNQVKSVLHSFFTNNISLLRQYIEYFWDNSIKESADDRKTWSLLSFELLFWFWDIHLCTDNFVYRALLMQYAINSREVIWP